MTFDYIVNPETRRNVSIFSTKGRSILRNYLKVQNAGAESSNPALCKDKRPPCPEGCVEYNYTDRRTGVKERRCRKTNARSGSPKPKREPSHCAGDVRPPCPEDCVEYTYTDRRTGAKERRCRKPNPRSASGQSRPKPNRDCADASPPCPEDCQEYTYTDRTTGAKSRRCRRKPGPRGESYGHTARDMGNIDVSDSDSHSHEHLPHHVGRPAEYPHGGSPRYYY
jgi:hypothetical protein